MDEDTRTIVPPNEPARSLRISIIEGNIEGASFAITGGAILTGFALMLGANEFHLGLMSALLALSAIGQMVAAWLIGRVRRRKRLTVGVFLVSRLMWVFLGALWFLPIPPPFKLPVFLGVLFVSNFIVNIGGNTWLSWMTDLVPPEQRGRYWGKRNTINGLFCMAAGYGGSWLLDWMSALHLRAEAFALLFGLAAFWSCTALTVMSLQWEPPLRGEKPTPILKLFGTPFHDVRFRRVLLFSVLWSAVTSVASPFFGAHMITNLHMSYSTIALYSVVGGLIAAASQPLWGRLMDRTGCRPVLFLALCFCRCRRCCGWWPGRAVTGRCGWMPWWAACSGRDSGWRCSTSSSRLPRRRAAWLISGCRMSRPRW